MNNVILFKASPDDAEEDKYVVSLRGARLNVIVIPPIDFKFCNEEELKECLANFNNYSGLILSSPRCVTAISNALEMETVETSKLPVDPWTMLDTFVVGETTDQLATALGLKTNGKECGNAKLLADYIATKKFAKPLLYPMGNLAKDTLKTSLEVAAIAVDGRVVYQTIDHPNLEMSIQSLGGKLPASIVFFSPSGVDAVFALFKKFDISFSDQKIYAIGPTTEAALLKHIPNVAGTAAKPTPEALLSVLLPS